MYCRWLCCARKVLILPLLLVAVSAGAAPAAPTLFRITSATPALLAQGEHESWPIKFDETAAMDAVFEGGLWLPNPAGGRIYAKYQRHILHANGTWTWIGSVSTVHGEQSVVLTFGKHAMFGAIPQTSGWPLEISSAHGQTHIVATSTKALARSTAWLRLHSKPDAVIPPLSKQMHAMSAHPATATAASPVTIDVMVAYTPGFVTVYGSQDAALTRIQFLVDWTNQAYVNSRVYQQIRLVHTVEVDYPDNNSDTDALYDLTGINDTGPVAIPPSLQGIAPLRAQYGADLVAMIRPFDAAADAANECGVGWLDGTGETVPIAEFGYSVVSDKADGTITDDKYCATNTFAHELGHNMGDAHDRANATSVGAYRYSYGYLGNGTYGFSTIMGYGTATDTPLQVFSNPNISTCQNTPCGVPDDASDSADNAHSMNNTAPVIAAFEPSMGSHPVIDQVRTDVNGDGRSDMLWRYSSSTGWAFGYWLFDGPKVTQTWSIPTSSMYHVAATGDFNGDGYLDIAWTSARHDIKIWFGNGNSFSGSNYVASYSPGWDVVGAGDIDGDGKTDLLFRYKSGSHGRFGYWIMNGSKRVRTWSTGTSTVYRVGATGDFNGDGKLDIAWTSNKGDVKLWLGNGQTFSSSKYVASYGAGWMMAGAGDIDGDGKSDLLFVYKSGSTARFGYWIQDGASRQRTWSTSFDADYHIASAGDFNGDGLLDVTWTSSARDIRLWTGDGTKFSGNTFVRSYGSGWQPISDTP